MSFIAHPTIEQMQEFGFEHRYIVAMAEASKEYEAELLKKAAIRDKPEAQTPTEKGSDNERD